MRGKAGGVYGAFVEYFMELEDTFRIWESEPSILTEGGKLVRAIYMPNGGDGLKRRKYTSGNTAIDLIEDDDFYVRSKYHLNVGDYVCEVGDNILMRLTTRLPYDKAGGYQIFKIERVNGTTNLKDEALKVKEATFA